jgi:hypothetical protein
MHITVLRRVFKMTIYKAGDISGTYLESVSYIGSRGF